MVTDFEGVGYIYRYTPVATPLLSTWRPPASSVVETHTSAHSVYCKQQASITLLNYCRLRPTQLPIPGRRESTGCGCG